MGSPTLETFNLLCRSGTPNPISDERLVRFERSGAWRRAIDHPNYDELVVDLASKMGEPVIRRAKALNLDTCGPELDLPFRGARIWTDVYGEGDGSFDLTKVEPLKLDTSLRLGPALEAVMPRRCRLSMGARRNRWFVKNADAGTLPPEMQKLADQWNKEGKRIFFLDTSWLNHDEDECVECAWPDDGRWCGGSNCVDHVVFEGCCVLVST